MAGVSAITNDNIDIRILCLHGKGGNGQQFVNSALRPLRALLEKKRLMVDNQCNDNDGGFSFHWESLTAPYELDDGGGYSWWTMPPGVRSYNAQEYEGFVTSEQMVMDKISNSDIVFGHSQGAILVASLLSIHDKLRDVTNNDSPIAYVLNGVAWPNPYRESLQSLSEQQSTQTNVKSPSILFIMGKEDNINPIESAMQVYDAFKDGNDVSIVEHARGHSVPIGNDDDSIRALEDISDWIMDIAKSKANKFES